MLKSINRPAVMVHVLRRSPQTPPLRSCARRVCARPPEACPLLNVRVVARQIGVFRHNAELFLPREHLLPIDVPASSSRLALVFVRPFLRDMVRRMVCARSEVEEKRLVWGDLLEVSDEADRLIGEIRCPDGSLSSGVFGGSTPPVHDCRRRGRDNTDGCRRRGSHNSVPDPRPSGRGRKAPRGADLLGRRQGATLADAIGGVGPAAAACSDKERVLERYRAIPAGVAGRSLGNAGHRIGMVIAARSECMSATANRALSCACRPSGTADRSWRVCRGSAC